MATAPTLYPFFLYWIVDKWAEGGLIMLGCTLSIIVYLRGPHFQSHRTRKLVLILIL